MAAAVPDVPMIYHILHVDGLPAVIASGGLLCDAEVTRRANMGTTIGMQAIKDRRLHELRLSCYPDLLVGDCVPFYFCPRSVMLYLIHKGNHRDLSYSGGQEPIVHIEADLRQTVDWAERHGLRWVFTLTNAGSRFFEDRCDLAQLGEIDWDAVRATDWRLRKEGKQAELLVQRRFPWELVARIGVNTEDAARRVSAVVRDATHRPPVEIRPDWYY